MKFKKLGALILGAILTVGIAAGVGLNSEGQRVDAATGTWNLVKDVDNIAVGDKVIIAAKNSNVAMSTTQNGNNRSQATITKSDNSIASPSDNVQIFTLEAGTVDNTYAFNTESGYIYAASSSKNYLRTQATNDANGSWTIEIADDGVATITAQGTNTRNLLKYNSQSSIFSCYGSGQLDVVLYKLEVGTTEPETPAATLSSLSISGELAKTEYYASESWDPSGLTVTGNYTDGSRDVTDQVNWTYDPANPSGLEVGDHSLKIKAIIGEIESDAVPFDVTVIEPEKYELVTNVNSLHEGMKVAIGATYNETSYALSTTQNTNNRTAVEATISNNEMVISSDIQVFTLEAGTVEGTYAFNTGSEYIYAASSSDNYLRTENEITDNSSWEIDINSGIASIISKGDYTRNDLRFNNNNKIFSAYASSSSLTKVSIYSEPIEKIYPTSISVNDINIPQGDSAFIDFNVEPANAIIENDSYESDNENITIENRSIKCNSTAEIGSVATITVTVQGQEGPLSTEFNVTVVEPRVLSLSFSNYTSFIVGQTLSDIENGTLTAKTTSGDKVLTLDDVTITLDDEEITSDREFTLEDNGKKIKFTYLSVSTNSYTITVTENTTEEPEDPEVPGDTTYGYSYEKSESIADYADANGWVNSTQYTSITLDDNITVTATGGGNTGKYYTSGENWRIYQNEDATITISTANSWVLSSVTIYYTINNTGVLTHNGENITTGTEVAVNNTQSIEFSVGNTGSATNGQVRITSITVEVAVNTATATGVAAAIKHMAGGWDNKVSTPNCANNYNTANELVLALSAEELETFKTSSTETEIGKARETYKHWCDVNGATPYTPQTPAGSNLIAFDNQNYLIVIIALAALSAFAFVYVAKRKQRKIEL